MTDIQLEAADVLQNLPPHGRNGVILATLNADEATRDMLAPLLATMRTDIEAAADRLHDETGLSVYLGRILHAKHLLKAWETILDAMTAEALANGDQKVDAAAALGVRSSTLSKQLGRIEPIMDAIHRANRSGEDMTVETTTGTLTIHPGGRFDLD